MPLASLLSTIISSRESDSNTLVVLQLVELLIEKVPDVYLRSFHREGILNEICKIADEKLTTVSTTVDDARDPASLVSGSNNGITELSAKSTTLGADNAGGSRLELVSTESSFAKESTPPTKLEDTNSDSKPDVTALAVAEKAAANAVAEKKRVSSVPTNPHDAIIVRCRVLRVKKDLDCVGRRVKEGSNLIELIKRLTPVLSDPSSSSDALIKTLEELAQLFVEEREPLSSYELLHSGLLDELMRFVVSDDGHGKLGMVSVKLPGSVDDL